MKKKWAGVLIIALSLFCLIVCARSIATEHSQGSVIQKEEADEAVLLGEYWSEGSRPAESLNEYIASVTDQSSPDYIPVEKRIAVRARPTWFWLMTRSGSTETQKRQKRKGLLMKNRGSESSQ